MSWEMGCSTSWSRLEAIVLDRVAMPSNCEAPARADRVICLTSSIRAGSSMSERFAVSTRALAWRIRRMATTATPTRAIVTMTMQI